MCIQNEERHDARRCGPPRSVFVLVESVSGAGALGARVPVAPEGARRRPGRAGTRSSGFAVRRTAGPVAGTTWPRGAGDADAGPADRTRAGRFARAAVDPAGASCVSCS